MLKHLLSGIGLVVGVVLLAPAANAAPYVGVHVGYGGVGVRVGGYYHPGYYGHYPRYYVSGWGTPWYYGTFYSNPTYYSNYYVGPTYVPRVGYYSPTLSAGTGYVLPGYTYQSFYPPAASTIPPAPAVPAQDPNTVLVNVRLPNPNAQVWIDGSRTTQQGTNRQFISPPLTPGQKYSYEIEARWTENGKEVSQKRKVAIQAGQTVSVDFTKP